MGPLRVTPVAEELGGAGGASRATESNYGGENADSELVSVGTDLFIIAYVLKIICTLSRNTESRYGGEHLAG